MSAPDLENLFLLRRFVEIAHHIPGQIQLHFTNKLVSILSKHKLSSLEKYCTADSCLQRCTLNADTESLILEYQPAKLSPSLLDNLFGHDDLAAKQALEQLSQLL